MFHQSVVPFCLFDIHAGELGQAERGSVRDLGEVRGAYLQAQTERIRNAVDEIGDAGDVLPLNLDQALAEGWVSKRVQPELEVQRRERWVATDEIAPKQCSRA